MMKALGRFLRMSIKIIQRLVIPVVERMTNIMGDTFIEDVELEKFLLNELCAMFGLAGGNNCEMLEAALEDARNRDPVKFNEMIRKLVEKYLKLRDSVRPVKSDFGEKRPEIMHRMGRKKKEEAYAQVV